MPATISVNFCSKADVEAGPTFAPANKSVSAQVLSDVLGTTGAAGGFVKRNGDTMTGLLTLAGAPTNSLHAATKSYVDGRTATNVIGVNVVDINGNSRTVTAADNNTVFFVRTSNSSEVVINLPGGIPVGTTVSVIRWGATSDVRLAAGSGGNIYNSDNTFTLFGRYSLATAIVASNNVWIVTGDLR